MGDAAEHAGPGAVEASVRAAVADLAALSGVQEVYAQIAFRLARHLDLDADEGSTGIAGVSRELRAALDAIWQGVKHVRPSDALTAGLATPDR